MNRRDFLKTLALSGSALALEPLVMGQALAQMPLPTLSSQPRDRMAYLVSRLTYGMTPDLFERVSQMDATDFIEEQLAPESLDDSVADNLLENYPIYNLTTAEIVQQYEKERHQVVLQLVGRNLTGAIASQRGLYEMMVNFWSDHFNIYIGKGVSLFLKVADDRDVIRPHALGKFRDLLFASSQSPAMLFYLDNALSNAQYPNENYARELLELHTLGVGGGYTEADVKAVARVLTGWSIVRLEEDKDNAGTFAFRKRLHDDAPQTVLGFPINGQGMEAGQQVLEILATHPSTARFISTKLVRRFVADVPPDRLVEQCTQTFLATDGDIREILRVIFNADEFWSAPPKFKRPYEYFVGVLRALAFQVTNQRAFRKVIGESLESLGQTPFTWPAPNGFPDMSAYWLSNLLPRWNLAISAVSERTVGHPDFERLGALATNSGQTAMDFMATYLLGRTLIDAEMSVVATFVDGLQGSDEQKNLAVLALLLASPAFQYR